MYTTYSQYIFFLFGEKWFDNLEKGGVLVTSDLNNE